MGPAGCRCGGAVGCGLPDEAMRATALSTATQNSNDNVFSTVSAAQRATMLLDYVPVPRRATGRPDNCWCIPQELREKVPLRGVCF